MLPGCASIAQQKPVATDTQNTLVTGMALQSVGMLIGAFSVGISVAALMTVGYRVDSIVAVKARVVALLLCPISSNARLAFDGSHG